MTDAHTLSAPARRTPGGITLKVALTVLIAAIAPLALYLLPSLQHMAVGVIYGRDSQVAGSYDPAHPLKTISSNSSGFEALGNSIFAVPVALTLSFLVSVALYFALVAPLYRNTEFYEHCPSLAIIGGGVGALVVLILLAVLVMPNSDVALAKKDEPAQVAQWVEGRYGLSLDEADAGVLLEATQGGDFTDPVLIDGHLLNLTRIAQGGYVLTDDKSATELPTTY